MLKFRMSNSTKARRAAEAQRRALEEKLKMEWAWKPMAAVMNERESDLVYWVPPLYTSNLLTSFSSSRSSSICTTLSSSPSTSFKRSSIKRPSRSSSIKLIQSSLAEITSPTRKKKLARRRAKLSPDDSIQEDDDDDTPATEAKKRRDEPTTDDDKESGIHEEFVDSSSMDGEVCRESISKIKVKTLPRQSSERSRCFSNKKDKFKHIPTLLKVINKLATIYSLPTRPTPIVAARRLERFREQRKNSIAKRPKRPSVKIYSVPSRSSMKKSKLSEEGAKPDPYYVITRTKTPFGSRQQSFSGLKTPFGSRQQSFSGIKTPFGSRQPSFSGIKTPFGSRQQSFSDTASNNRTHIGLPTLTENELRNAHLEMILKILANLYEEKLVTQTTEISQLKTKVQGQEKLLKQTARVVIDVQEQLKTLQAKFDYNEKLQKFNRMDRIGHEHSEVSFPYHPLEPLPEEDTESTSNNHRKVSRKFTCPDTNGEYCQNLEISDPNYLELSQNSSPSSYDDSSEHTPSILISGHIETRHKDDTTTIYSIPKERLSTFMLNATSPVVLKPDESQRRASTPIGIPRSILKTSQTRSLDLVSTNESILTSSEFDSTFFSSGEIPLSPFTHSDISNSESHINISHLESHIDIPDLESFKPKDINSQESFESGVTAISEQLPSDHVEIYSYESKNSSLSNHPPLTTAEVHFSPPDVPEVQKEEDISSDVFKSVLVIEIGKVDVS